MPPNYRTKKEKIKTLTFNNLHHNIKTYGQPQRATCLRSMRSYLSVSVDEIVRSAGPACAGDDVMNQPNKPNQSGNQANPNQPNRQQQQTGQSMDPNKGTGGYTSPGQGSHSGQSAPSDKR
jgi:hypothetical protein